MVRVTLECALAERAWNAYYAHLLAALVAASKGHRVTLQFCMWDHFKQARALSDLPLLFDGQLCFDMAGRLV